MRNPFKRNKLVSDTLGKLRDADMDPIYVTHTEDPSLGEDEMIIHTFVDPNSIKKEEE